MIRRTLYVAPDTPAEARTEFLREAQRRGVRFLAESGDYFLAAEDGPNLLWAVDVAWEAYEVPIPSIATGARNLMEALRAAFPEDRGAGRRWLPLAGEHHRRAALIGENLALGAAAELAPPDFASPPRAGYFLLAPDRAVAVFDSLGPYPGGVLPFAEQRAGPPSRAYLKLWEAFARLRVRPRAGETALDLGSCPGGWTWALAELGAAVLSVDGAPIDPRVAARPNVEFRKGDAFRLAPDEARRAFPERAKIDWLCSDMICEPKRLPELLERWIDSGICERYVVSVKFKGEADAEALARLAAIPGGHLRHLRQNKHELTWFRAPELARI